MRLALCLCAGLFAALAACGGNDPAAPGAGGEGSVSSSTDVTATVTSAGAGGNVATTTTTGAGGSTSTAAGGGGGGDSGAPTIMATIDPTTMAAGAVVTVSVSVTNFKLVPAGGPNVAGEGHYHVYLDAATGGNYLFAGQTPTAKVKIPLGTASGPHTIRVNISNNDHSPLNPPVEEILPITVE